MLGTAKAGGDGYLDASLESKCRSVVKLSCTAISSAPEEVEGVHEKDSSFRTILGVFKPPTSKFGENSGPGQMTARRVRGASTRI